MLKEDDEEDAECLHVQYSPEFFKANVRCEWMN
jgi:hypothetical protein